ncbi:MAG TPA: ABC transporter substrate-binding protein [Casimicrobiaceae bacterium]|nr:ABC transporter substrate-binding protein [Casimicrobiaceae bacterium]
MKRRKFISGVAAGASAALATGMWTRPVLAQAKPEVTRLTLAFGLDPVFVPHMVAMQKGWFKDAGFTEVSTKSFTGGAVAGEALVAGEIALWTPGNLPPISMTHSGVPVVVLGTNALAMSADRLIARKDANVRAPEDLYRMRIGLLQGSTASADLYYLAKHYNLDDKRLQVVNMQPPEQLAALNSNSVQAMLCWQPWGFNAQKSGNAELIHTGLQSEFAANKGKDAQISYTRSLFVASEEFVRKNPVATRRMMEVLVRAQRYVADPKNRSEMITLFVNETKQDRALADAIWDQYTFDPTFDDRYVRDMERLTEYLVASGRLKSPRHPLDYTFTDPVAAVDSSLVKVPGRFKA